MDNLRTLASYSDEEKIANFDKFYRGAREIIDEKAKTGHEPKQCEHWCYEMTMQLLGPYVWDVLNAL